MYRSLIASLTLFGALTFGIFCIMAADQPLPNLRLAAQQKLQDGNYKEALEIYKNLLKDSGNTEQELADDLQKATDCLRSLEQDGDIDALVASTLESHPGNWRLLYKAATLRMSGNHHGFIVAGEFTRGNRNGGGEYATSFERDRVQAILWMKQASDLVPADAAAAQIGDFYLNFAQYIQEGRTGQLAWQLQDLTELTELPDYQRGYQYGWGRSSSPRGAAVDENGNPIMYAEPESFAAAASDGERWRWCLEQSKKTNPTTASVVDFEFASFLREQFGVQTMQDWGIMLPRGDDDAQDASAAIWSLSSLTDDESIARLATGVKRFPLPQGFNFIKLFRTIGDSDGTYSQQALGALAGIYEDRQQYAKAADVWREIIRKFGKQNGNQERLDQIVNNWGQFENVMSQASGQGATVDYRFRNGKKVAFEAQAIKIPQLIADVQKYLESNPEQVDWQKTQIDDIGYRLVEMNESIYVGEKVAAWDLELEPRPHHFDRRITVTTPLQKAGAYLVTATMENGNVSRIVIWLNDLAIAKKQLDNKVLYYIGDARTGAPIDHAHVEFFGWKQDRVENTKRNYQIATQKFAEFSDADGTIITDENLLNNAYQWLTTVRTDTGQFAHLGFTNVWYNKYYEEAYKQAKTYVVTDRPVYRPDQTVKFKFWMRETDYDKKDGSQFANKQFTVKVNDPEGTEVFSEKLTTDEFGGLNGEYLLSKEAKLGVYQLFINREYGLSGGNQFRVEEYKKPEYEVTIDSPTEPVQLGEKIKATITAKYFYGAPVTQAKVKYKVERSTHDARWYPVTRWDWLYGNGYWWFASDYDWYPGFGRWGCIAPRPFWFDWNPDPPELVLDQEVEIGEDGTVQVEIDSSLAKALHGDQDHKYSITAEVVDASRRTIVGSGNVLVAREPFKVFAWTNRGHYQVGDTIKASFQARTLDGKGVAGTGVLKLFKVQYKDGEPVEQVAQEWNLDTDNEGRAEQTLKASDAGQYRLSYTLTSKDGKAIEGGYLFVIRGEGFDGSEYRFNDLELITNQDSYKPGDKVELLINTNRVGSTVLLFLRPLNSAYKGKPQILRLDGKSTTVSIDVANKDMPNFFVEAVTISDGDVHTVVQEIVVPPEDRVVNVEVLPSADRYLPGQEATVDVKLTDADGEPFNGSIVLSVYDRAVEYVSGGSNVAEIKEFFWKWKREHRPQTEHNLMKYFAQMLKNGEISMTDLGAFGGQVAEMEKLSAQDKAPQMYFKSENAMMRKGGAYAAPMALQSMVMDSAEAAPGAAGGEAPTVEPTVRTQFADTAFWAANLTTDAKGLATVNFKMPENLGAWKLRAWGMGHGTNVGEGTTEVVTSKNILVRLQSPRFFTEKDEVVLSAVVHNYLDVDKEVDVQLILEGRTLAPIEETKNRKRFELSEHVTIKAGGEQRVNWRVKAVAPGDAIVTMKALTDVESDAMQMTFPVNVHGFLKTESFSGVVRSDETSNTIKINVPEKRNPEQTRLEIRYSPTLAGAMVDALPYLAEYPYGCTEQTLNRFVPTVITQGILKHMGVNLREIQDKRTNLNAQEIGDDVERAKQWKRFDRNPVFDEAEVDKMVKQGVKDLAAMQNSDGGWGWFSGRSEYSYPHTTAVVVHGLQVADKNNIAIVQGVIERGTSWLTTYQNEQVVLLKEWEAREKIKDAKKLENRKKPYKASCSNVDAMVFSVLVDSGVANAEMQRYLYRDRLELSLYSQALVGLAFDTIGADEDRDMIIRNIDQFIKVDPENQTAYIDMPNGGYWWNWYGSTIEANAHYLKLLTRTDVKNPKAAGLVKYILNNRKHGTYWNSTRDTAYCIEALAEYLVASGEGKPNMAVEVWIDGEQKQTVEINAENLFTYNNAFIIEGEALTAGQHTVELRRKTLGESEAGPLYHNAYLTNFTKEDFITAAGLEIKVQRKFYRLIQDKDATKAVAGSRGQVVDQKSLKYNREELVNLAEVKSGDLIEVELEIDSKNDYEYILFEDAKAAGTEAVDLQSGYTPGGLGAYVEFRDEKVAFFVRALARGKHSVSYRLRAEIPGKFSALPVKASAMYAPELRANSDEMKLRIAD